MTLSTKQHQLFKKLKENGYFPSVSAGIRYCINISLPKFVEEIKLLDDYIQNNNSLNVFEKLIEFGYTIHKNRQTILKKPIISTLINGKNEVIQ